MLNSSPKTKRKTQRKNEPTDRAQQLRRSIQDRKAIGEIVIELADKTEAVTVLTQTIIKEKAKRIAIIIE